MGDISTEPSMEDILSSIKRIIAEEGDGAVTTRGRRPARSALPLVEASEPAVEEVLELREPVDTAQPSSPAEPAPAPSLQSPSPAPPAATAAPERAAPVETILSPRAAEASRGSLDALSRMVVKPQTAGSDSLESMVREMLRPMLADWLDAKLPEMVEGMVAREIARITGQAR